MAQVICRSTPRTVGWEGGGDGAFSRDSNMNLSLQCRAFTRTFQNEKLKSLLFTSPVAGRGGLQ